MPSRERVEAFIAAVVGGDHVQAIANFYVDDASMRENAHPPRKGRAALMEHEANALKRIQRMHTHPVEKLLVDGDNVVIKWKFDMTDASGVTRRLEELSLQLWRGDRIAEEQFFYDSASAWRPLEQS